MKCSGLNPSQMIDQLVLREPTPPMEVTLAIVYDFINEHNQGALNDKRYYTLQKGVISILYAQVFTFRIKENRGSHFALETAFDQIHFKAGTNLCQFHRKVSV
jgi:hypothetical protein